MHAVQLDPFVLDAVTSAAHHEMLANIRSNPEKRKYYIENAPRLINTRTKEIASCPIMLDNAVRDHKRRIAEREKLRQETRMRKLAFANEW